MSVIPSARAPPPVAVELKGTEAYEAAEECISSLMDNVEAHIRDQKIDGLKQMFALESMYTLMARSIHSAFLRADGPRLDPPE